MPGMGPFGGNTNKNMTGGPGSIDIPFPFGRQGHFGPPKSSRHSGADSDTGIRGDQHGSSNSSVDLSQGPNSNAPGMGQKAHQANQGPGPDGQGHGGQGHGGQGGTVVSSSAKGPNPTGGKQTFTGRYESGTDYASNVQYWTAQAQGASQGSNGLNGLSNSFGQAHAGVANAGAKTEEAETERVRGMLEGVNSLDDSAKETMRSLIDTSQAINNSRNQTLNKILG